MVILKDMTVHELNPKNYSEMLITAYNCGGACVGRGVKKDKSISDMETWISFRICGKEMNPLEHLSLTVTARVDIGLGRELVRHRVASVYSQESTRYVDNSNWLEVIYPRWFFSEMSTSDKLFHFGENFTDVSVDDLFDQEKVKSLLGTGHLLKKDIVNIDYLEVSPSLSPIQLSFVRWYNSCVFSLFSYREIHRSMGKCPDFSRQVLTLSTASNIIITKPVNMWRDFIKQRTSVRCHPSMVCLANSIRAMFQMSYPVFFEDLPCKN